MRSFVRTSDWSRAELTTLIEDAMEMKADRRSSDVLRGRSIALVFFNPSLRTRASMQVAIYELGGNPVILEPGGTSWTVEHRDGVVMDGSKTEHIREFIGVLERYVSAIGVRTFAELKDWRTERTDPVLAAFEAIARVPVINLESAMHHPCQAMADMMTIRERFGSGKKKVLLTWAWHPKPLPMAVPNSFAMAAVQFGHDLRIAHPPGYDLDDELLVDINRAASESGGSVEIVDYVEEAFEDVEVVYAKSWGSKAFYGSADNEVSERAKYRPEWIVDTEKMRRTADAVFMHCLPVRRNVIVTDEVLDSDRSVVLDEAENRLHIQKAILKTLGI